VQNHSYLEVKIMDSTEPIEFNSLARAHMSAEQVESRNGQMAQVDTQVQTDFHHVIHVSKFAGRKLEDDVLTKFVDQMISAVNTSARIGRGWKMDLRPVVEGETAWYRIEFLTESMTGPRKYHIFFNLNGHNPKANPEAELGDAVKALEAKGASFGGHPFVIEAVDGNAWEQSTESKKAERGNAQSQVVGYAPFHLPDDYMSYFDHLFGLDAHIRRVAKALQLAEQSGFTKRVHTVLQGPPGCGKTEIALGFKDAIGSDAVYVIDATSATKAGIQDDIDNFVEMPRVIIIEEIEKAPSELTSVLLGVMDQRGEVRKTTARGKINKEMRCVVIATVNNWQRFREMNWGALSSRFANTIHFTRPDDDLLTMILEREIDDVKGNGTKGSGKKFYKWIKPTLKWCKEVDNRDPRYVIAVCLTGQDDLMTDEYFVEMRQTMHHDDEMEVVFDA